MKIPKELIKEFVKSEDFKSTGDIMTSIKDMFADVMNEVLQCEIEEKLGDFKEKWHKEYPSAIKSWEVNWYILSTFFAFIIYILP